MFGRKKRARRGETPAAPELSEAARDEAPGENGTGVPAADEKPAQAPEAEVGAGNPSGSTQQETTAPENAQSTTEPPATEQPGPGADVVDAPDPRADGPWDESQLPGNRDEYVDLGCVLLKPREGVAVRLDIHEALQQPWALNLDYGEGSVQLQAFAAPKSTGLWDEVRRELTEGLRRDGAQPAVARGPLGLQVNAKLPATTPSGAPGYRSARFVGIDGPRWFLRAVYTGAAATPTPTAQVLDDVVRSLVIVRGREAMAPRDLLPFTVPDTAVPLPQPPAVPQPGAAGQPSSDGQGAEAPGPRRGPEITEIG